MTQQQPQKEPPVIGAHLLKLRKAKRLTLEELSLKAGVSKSMLSQIERNEANPTVAVLWRLANALQVELSDILSLNQKTIPAQAITKIAAHDTPIIQGQDQLSVLRILGPTNLIGSIEWYELTMEPYGKLESEPHQAGSHEHLSVLDGIFKIEVDGECKNVESGETARYACDRKHIIRNDSDKSARAILVVQYN